MGGLLDKVIESQEPQTRGNLRMLRAFGGKQAQLFQQQLSSLYENKKNFGRYDIVGGQPHATTSIVTVGTKSMPLTDLKEGINAAVCGLFGSLPFVNEDNFKNSAYGLVEKLFADLLTTKDVASEEEMKRHFMIPRVFQVYRVDVLMWRFNIDAAASMYDDAQNVVVAVIAAGIVNHGSLTKDDVVAMAQLTMGADHGNVIQWIEEYNRFWNRVDPTGRGDDGDDDEAETKMDFDAAARGQKMEALKIYRRPRDDSLTGVFGKSQDDFKEEEDAITESFAEFVAANQDALPNDDKLDELFKERLRDNVSDTNPLFAIVLERMNDVSGDPYTVSGGQYAAHKETEGNRIEALAEIKGDILQFMESKGTHIDEMGPKARDWLTRKATEYMQKVLDGVLQWAIKIGFDIQNGERMVRHLWAVLRAIPIIGHLLPPFPKSLQGVLPPPEDVDKFYNWALTVKTNPDKVFELESENDIINLIRKAVAAKKKVRVSTFRHSFSPLFSDGDEYYHGLLLSKDMTDTHVIDKGYVDIEFDDEQKPTWAQVRGLAKTRVTLLDNNKIRVAFGASNMVYAKLAAKRLENGLSFPSEPTNVLQLFQGYSGTHAVGCHGGGIMTTTLCDYITKITMINHKGEKVTYADAGILKKMANHLGLLGIVTEMEIQYDDPYLAKFQGQWKKIDEYLPEKGTCDEFQKDVGENFYAEFFWWPTSDEVFVNVWKQDPDLSNYQRMPDHDGIIKEEAIEIIGQTMNELFPCLNAQKGTLGLFWATMIGVMARYSMQEDPKPIRTPSFDALHFRRGLQNMRVLDTEFMFPLPELKDDDGNVVKVEGHTVPDVSLCRDLFRAVVDLVKKYKADGKFPQLLPCEWRIIKGSEVCLSPAHGFPFVVYIEVLTPISTAEANQGYYDYCQELIDVWGDIAGTESMRPHWGKYWQTFSIKNKQGTRDSIFKHLQKTYKDDIAEFNQIRESADPDGLFMNDALSQIFDGK